MPLCEWKSHGDPPRRVVRIIAFIYKKLFCLALMSARKHQPRLPVSRQDLVQCHPSMWHSTNHLCQVTGPTWWVTLLFLLFPTLSFQETTELRLWWPESALLCQSLRFLRLQDFPCQIRKGHGSTGTHLPLLTSPVHGAKELADRS